MMKSIAQKMGAGVFVCAVLGLTYSGKSIADEITLKASAAFPLGTSIIAPFERFVERVNEQGKGLVQIDLVGGPDAIPPFQQGKAVQSGVVDMAAAPGVYYTNVVPEGAAIQLTTATAQQMRNNGTLELLNKIWNKKGLYFLARTWEGVPFNIYLKKPLKNNSFEGVKLRTTPNYRPFFSSLGAVNVEISPGEVYTALERGVVDGAGWTATGLFDLGWHEQLKYRVEPAFYAASVELIINLDKWKSLTEEQKDFLTKQAIWYESLNQEQAEFLSDEIKKQEDAGIKVIALDDDIAADFIKKAYETAWEVIAEQAPENVEELREAFQRK